MYYDFLVEKFQTLHSLDFNDLSAMYRKTNETVNEIVNETVNETVNYII